MGDVQRIQLPDGVMDKIDAVRYERVAALFNSILQYRGLNAKDTASIAAEVYEILTKK